MFFITAMIPNGFIFGWAKPIPVAPYYFKSRQRGMMLVGLVGPLTNFASPSCSRWCSICSSRPQPTIRGGARMALHAPVLALEVNVVWASSILIPVPPLTARGSWAVSCPSALTRLVLASTVTGPS